MKLVVWSLLLASCLCGCSSKDAQQGPPPVGISVFQVAPQTIPQDFEFVGVARSSHLVEIRSRVEGYLNSIDYPEGGMVEENQMLFQIDPRQFEATVEEAKGNLAMQDAILWRANQSLNRIRPLFQKNAVSQRDLDNAIAGVLTAEAAVIEARASLYKADLNLSYTRITSPIKGLAGRSIYREGTLITPSINGLLTYVSVIDPIWVYFSIADNMVLLGKTESAKNQLILPQQQDYSVSLELSDGSQFPHTGRVNFASPSLDPETGALMVRAEFRNPQGTLLPGQFVRAKVSGAMRPDAIFVPQQSVFQGKNGMFVFIVNKDNTVSSRPVIPGEWVGNFWVIKQGLAKGDVVVVEGVNKVQDGTHVHILSVVPPPQPAAPKDRCPYP